MFSLYFSKKKKIRTINEKSVLVNYRSHLQVKQFNTLFNVKCTYYSCRI